MQVVGYSSNLKCTKMFYVRYNNENKTIKLGRNVIIKNKIYFLTSERASFLLNKLVKSSYLISL